MVYITIRVNRLTLLPFIGIEDLNLSMNTSSKLLGRISWEKLGR